MSDSRFALALAGGPSAGKTTVARAIADRIGARRISFGDYVRARAAETGQETSREQLQQLGQDLLGEFGAEGLCLATLSHAGGRPEERPVIWDGVRHLVVADALRALYEDDLRLGYLNPPSEARRFRLAEQANSDAQLARWEADATEAEGEALKRAADLICVAARVEDAIDEVFAFVTRLGE